MPPALVPSPGGWYHAGMRSTYGPIRLARELIRSAGLVILTWGLTGSSLVIRDTAEQVRRFTRAVEFDFATWTLDAAVLKLGQFGLGAAGYLASGDRLALVREYADQVAQASRLEEDLVGLTADPSRPEAAGQAGRLRQLLAELRSRQAGVQPLAETIIEEQITVALAQAGLAVGGVVFPPVSFHITPLPLALIVSPRQVIRQDANIQLEADLTLEAVAGLETRVESALDVSALVVPVGGIGTYPTMVMESSALSWLLETVAHEWVHNYLTLRPLGIAYDSGPELRTMNETAASLLGTAISRRVLQGDYPDLLPPPQSEAAPAGSPPAFDFRAEMHATRLAVDALLAHGEIEEAEALMESRRQVFWDNGYRIRRLNQAYFAFYGAYADEPGGAAGVDPVGEAVRLLWARSPSPAAFLRRIAWMDSFADLQRALGEPVTVR